MGAHNELRRKIREANRNVPDGTFDQRYGLLITFAITALATHKRCDNTTDRARITEIADEMLEMMAAAGPAAPLPG